MSTTQVGKKLNHVAATSKKRQLRTGLIALAFIATVIYGMVGRATGLFHVGENSLAYYGRYFTYQTTWFVMVFYVLSFAYSMTGWKKLSWTTNKFTRLLVTVYYVWVMTVAVFIIAPMMTWGPESTSGSRVQYPEQSIWWWSIDTALVHGVLNLVVLWDYLSWEDVEKSDQELKWSHANYIAIYPLIWLTYTWLFTLIDGWVPYPFMDLGAYELWAVVLMHIPVGALFAGIEASLIWRDKKRRA